MLDGVVAEELLNPLETRPSAVWVDYDIFAWAPGGFYIQDAPVPFFGVGPRIYEIGFVATNDPNDETANGTETFYTTYVTQDYQGIFPNLLIDPTDTFYDFSHRFDPVLVSAFVIEEDIVFIYPPNLTIVAIHPLSVFVATDIFYSPSFTGQTSASLVIDTDVIRAQVIQRAGDDTILLLEVFNDIDTIFTPSFGNAVLPSLVTESDIIYSTAQTAYLLPPVFGADDVIIAPLVLDQLQPRPVLDTDTFIGPTMHTPGRMDLFVDSDIIYAAFVQQAPLLPSLIGADDVFLSPVIGELAPLYPFDPIVDVADTFYVPSVIIFQGLAPHLWIDVDTVIPISNVLLGQVWPSPLVLDTDIFYTPIIPQDISPPLFVATDVFYVPFLIFDQTLAPSWIVDSDTFYVPTVSFPTQNLTVALFTDSDTFYAPTVAALSSFDGTLSIDGPIMPATHQPTVILPES